MLIHYISFKNVYGIAYKEHLNNSIQQIYRTSSYFIVKYIISTLAVCNAIFEELYISIGTMCSKSKPVHIKEKE